jgi:hypothetical protein
MGLLVATALGATLLGIGATFGIIYWTSKNGPAARDPHGASSSVHETTSATAPASSSVPSSTWSDSPPTRPAPVASNATTATSAATAGAGTTGTTQAPKPTTLAPLPATGRPQPKPPPTKSLDIQRDLPP